jgi:uncharacterized membrane protein (DUF373 family)
VTWILTVQKGRKILGVWQDAPCLFTLGTQRNLVDFREKNGPFYNPLMFYNSVRKIFSIYWFYDLYKGLIGLYQKSEVSLMIVFCRLEPRHVNVRS